MISQLIGEKIQACLIFFHNIKITSSSFSLNMKHCFHTDFLSVACVGGWLLSVSSVGYARAFARVEKLNKP